jgi:rubrerythrin|tara:strand:- start:601 stop:1128 length:528 start_codon:yes stop_codon:yes gene_type:complete
METYELQDYTEMFSYLTRHKGISLKLYISEVNNIAVDECEFRGLFSGPDNESSVRLTFSSRWKHKILYCFEVKSPQELMDEVLKLKDITFCKIENSFFTKEQTEKRNFHKFKNLVLPFENIKSEIVECSVCLDETTNKICCGHHLCFVCETKMNVKICPLCRKPYYHYHDDSDDE